MKIIVISLLSLNIHSDVDMWML